MKRILIFGAIIVLLIVTGLVFIIVNNDGKPPIALGGNITTQEETPVSITLEGSDPDEDTLTFSIISKPSHGSLDGTAPNLVYTPEKDFNGEDSFIFSISDGRVDSNDTTISITVTSINDLPVAQDDNVTVEEDTPIKTIDVLANDIDNDNDRLVVLETTQAENGSVTINTDNKIIYTPNKNFFGSDSFTYTISDGKGGTNTATVKIMVNPVNDAPVISSKPVTTARAWGTYSYDVKARDSDDGDILTFNLEVEPEGMSIDPNTGLIEWEPTSSQVGDHDVTVKVTDNSKSLSSDTQSFKITVASLDSPLTSELTVEDFYLKNIKSTSSGSEIVIFQESDDQQYKIDAGSYVSFDFSDASIPAGANIASIILYIEHFESSFFPIGKLQWEIGTGWPKDEEVWATINAPVREEQSSEATDSWDITSIVDTSEKIDALQLQINNNSKMAGKSTFVDNIYAIVHWY